MIALTTVILDHSNTQMVVEVDHEEASEGVHVEGES